jgi:hypothetical protein
MAKYCLNMLEMALRLANHDSVYEDVAVKFFEHFATIAAAMGTRWDERDGFFYDHWRKPDGAALTIRSRSMVGLLPIFAAVELPASLWERVPHFRARANCFIFHKPALTAFLRYFAKDDRPELVCLVDASRLRRVLARMLDAAEFLSPYGLRSLSRVHRAHPRTFEMDGVDLRLAYEPGESRTGLLGDNSNWRGPIWFPLNCLAVESLRHLHRSLGERYKVELLTGSSRQAHLGELADEIERRLLRIFLRDGDGERPLHGANTPFRGDRNEYPDEMCECCLRVRVQAHDTRGRHREDERDQAAAAQIATNDGSHMGRKCGRGDNRGQSRGRQSRRSTPSAASTA